MVGNHYLWMVSVLLFFVWICLLRRTLSIINFVKEEKLPFIVCVINWSRLLYVSSLTMSNNDSNEGFFYVFIHFRSRIAASKKCINFFLPWKQHWLNWASGCSFTVTLYATPDAVVDISIRLDRGKRPFPPSNLGVVRNGRYWRRRGVRSCVHIEIRS